jgi:hypothetical protein
MTMFARIAGFAGGLLTLASVEAGQIGYRINSGPTQVVNVSATAPFTNLTINLGVVDQNTVVHVFDIRNGGADPVDTLGKITLRGKITENFPSGLPVKLVVADESIADPGSVAFDRIDLVVQLLRRKPHFLDHVQTRRA